MQKETEKKIKEVKRASNGVKQAAVSKSHAALGAKHQTDLKVIEHKAKVVSSKSAREAAIEAVDEAEEATEAEAEGEEAAEVQLEESKRHQKCLHDYAQKQAKGDSLEDEPYVTGTDDMSWRGPTQQGSSIRVCNVNERGHCLTNSHGQVSN